MNERRYSDYHLTAVESKLIVMGERLDELTRTVSELQSHVTSLRIDRASIIGGATAVGVVCTFLGGIGALIIDWVGHK